MKNAGIFFKLSHLPVSNCKNFKPVNVSALTRQCLTSAPAGVTLVPETSIFTGTLLEMH